MSGRECKVIAALDVQDGPRALELVDQLIGKIDFFKVGSRLFTAEGPPLVKAIREKGGRVFIDLKFHDIPATVAGAVKAACGLGVDMMTLHTTGGFEMMKEASRTAAEVSAELGRDRPVLVGVTILTSMEETDLEVISPVKYNIADIVHRLASRAEEAGLDGIVCSVWEAGDIREKFRDDFVIVTPGIRPAGTGMDDQKRVATPARAAEAGSDYLVIGRPIYQAPRPAEAAAGILEELEVL
ncbi:MAG: orotidine-5'-phosphate decarboxylase [Candidatus Latescibacteria bacterium]|nr:orotidine-5'-phosphate decarboxylase [bacterium]MBD3424136.1 orotidine-5'-phosphate decarboxylase [Candidatus Latescibacterota bacterium]